MTASPSAPKFDSPLPLIVATGNPGKVQEFSAFFSRLGSAWPWQPQPKPVDLEIEETGHTFAANARQKAAQVAQATGQWAIADDSGLAVAALGGAPGIYSARYATTDAGRIARLLQEMDGVTDRQAYFVCAIALCRPDGSLAIAVNGQCDGEILLAPQGTGGFGYDPIFFVPPAQRTFAEMTPDQKHQWGHRGQALQALAKAIADLPLPSHS